MHPFVEAVVTQSGKILIVDGDPSVRNVLVDYLTEVGYEGVAVANAEETLAKARSELFDVILVDLQMPQPDALILIAKLTDENPNLPIVAVSGASVLHDVVEAMRIGAWDHIRKPIEDMEAITVVIERVLDKAALIAERDRYQREIERLNRSLEAEVERQTQSLLLQNRRLKALNHVAHAISHSLELDAMLDRALDAAVSAMDADAGVIRLLNPSTGYLYVASSSGLDAGMLASSPPVALGEGLCGDVALHGHLRMGRHLSRNDWSVEIGTRNLKGFIYVPLRVSGGSEVFDDQWKNGQAIVGTLAVFQRAAQEFSQDHIELLMNIGTQLGLAVTRAQYAADLRYANAQLEEANEELRELDMLREQFIQNVAHELRTPLALVRGYVEMLAGGDLTSSERDLAVRIASERVRSLVELVEAITTLQDLDAHPLSIDDVAISELIDMACQMTAQRAAATGVQLRYRVSDPIPAVPGDFTRLAQALHQLLDNACKFSQPGSEVLIDTQLSHDGSHVLISVADEGIGISSEEHERIFERFYQVDGSPSRRYGGTGLGLALVREVAEGHDGWVGLESEPGEGSTFTVALPLR
jgi:signal transduction histidine kinase/FixJ family two-component response regulator